MALFWNKSLTARVEQAIAGKLQRLQESIAVDAGGFCTQLREAHGLPVSSIADLRSFPLATLDAIADQTIAATKKIAAIEGAGFGLGGWLTLPPDMAVLFGLTSRMIQKLGLLYGFEYRTDAEKAELWVAFASAAGVDITKELVEKELLERFAPRIIQMVARRAATEVVEKAAGRIVPVLSAGVGGTLNYFFVKTWGERAKRHFREKRLRFRALETSALMVEAPATEPLSHGELQS
jgi:EcsC family protein